jgi:hypothetical protein
MNGFLPCIAIVYAFGLLFCFTNTSTAQSSRSRSFSACCTLAWMRGSCVGPTRMDVDMLSRYTAWVAAAGAPQQRGALGCIALDLARIRVRGARRRATCSTTPPGPWRKNWGKGKSRSSVRVARLPHTRSAESSAASRKRNPGKKAQCALLRGTGMGVARGPGSVLCAAQMGMDTHRSTGCRKSFARSFPQPTFPDVIPDCCEAPDASLLDPNEPVAAARS